MFRTGMTASAFARRLVSSAAPSADKGRADRDRQTDRQADRQTDKKKERKKDR